MGGTIICGWQCAHQDGTTEFLGLRGNFAGLKFTVEETAEFVAHGGAYNWVWWNECLVLQLESIRYLHTGSTCKHSHCGRGLFE